MHPALSIIVFTTLSGLGYGLAAMLGLGLLDPAAIATKMAHLVALALIAAGLLSSTLHLGNPQRAWRAFSQWRSSWLSREGVMALLTFVPLCASAYASLLLDAYLPLTGLLGALMAAGTVYCTAMIYASLKAVQAWHTRLTPACYLLFAGAGGALLATLFASFGGNDPRLPAALATGFLIAAWATKLAWRRNALDAPPLSTPETATALGFIGRVRLSERPHGNENYLTREMGFRVARRHAVKLFGIALVLGFAMPLAGAAAILLLGSGWPAALIAIVAVAAHGLGMLIERWLFFAEARHAVMTYYGG